MNPLIQGIIGGSVPTIVMVVWYFMSTEKRLARIETDIAWLKRALR